MALTPPTRLSTARRLAFEAFFAAEGPVSAVHLAHALSIDESSVYRNLEVLERHGLIRHVHLGHGPGPYTLVGRHEVEYLACERCAKVTAVTPDQLDPVRKAIRKRFGWEARFTLRDRRVLRTLRSDSAPGPKPHRRTNLTGCLTWP